MVRRHQPPEADRRRRAVLFGLGLCFLWLASDWPLGPLGASYLAFVHMGDYLLYVLAAAPLLVAGTPEWLARRAVARSHASRVVRLVCRPLVAGLTFNVTLLITHAPGTVDTLRVSPGGSFLLDMAWLASGLLLWQPICSPLPELRIASKGVQAAYLWLSVGVICTVPSGFLVFSNYPIYRTFELAPHVGGISAVADQQLAGVVMKLGSMPVVWGAVVVLLYKWLTVADEKPRPGRRPSAPRPAQIDQPAAAGGTTAASNPRVSKLPPGDGRDRVGRAR